MSLVTTVFRTQACVCMQPCFAAVSLVLYVALAAFKGIAVASMI